MSVATIDVNALLLAIIGAMVTLMTVYLTRVNANTAKTLEATNVVHDLVNSKDTATQKSLDGLRAEVLKLATANATLIETQRTAEIEQARAEGAAERAAPPAATATISDVPQAVVADEPLPVRVVDSTPVKVETEQGRTERPPPPSTHQ